MLLKAAFFLALVFPVTTYSIFIDCGHLIEGRGINAKFRREIQTASLAYARKHPKYAISMLRGLEFPVLPITRSKNAHLIYFGSGPDIWRPLFDYPTVKHIHLMDLIVGWGKNPAVFFRELKRRLRFIGETRILDAGFTKALSPAEKKKEQKRKFWEGFHNRPGALKPLIIQVNIVSPALGRVTKFFYLHPLNIHKSEHITRVLNFIPEREPLVALLQAGFVGTPYASDLRRLFARMPQSGRFIYEHMHTPDFDFSQAKASLQQELGPGFEIDVVRPPEDIAKLQAQSDYMRLGRIAFSLIFRKTPILNTQSASD